MFCGRRAERQNKCKVYIEDRITRNIAMIYNVVHINVPAVFLYYFFHYGKAESKIQRMVFFIH